MNTSSYETVDKQWLWERGDLHDCFILAWHAQDGVTSFRIEDVWWNSEGFPDYKGPEPGLLVISGTRPCPDCSALVSQEILLAELVRIDSSIGLRLTTSEHPPTIILGETIRWYPETSLQDRPQP